MAGRRRFRDLARQRQEPHLPFGNVIRARDLIAAVTDGFAGDTVLRLFARPGQNGVANRGALQGVQDGRGGRRAISEEKRSGRIERGHDLIEPPGAEDNHAAVGDVAIDGVNELRVELLGGAELSVRRARGPQAGEQHDQDERLPQPLRRSGTGRVAQVHRGDLNHRRRGDQDDSRAPLRAAVVR